MKRLHLLALLAIAHAGAVFTLVACSDDDTPSLNTDPETDSGPDRTAPEPAETGAPDSGPADSGTDATGDGGSAIYAFVDELAERMCNAYTRCCFGSANVPDGGAADAGNGDAGSFDRGACLTTYKTGLEGSTLDYTRTIEGVTLNTAKRDDCFAKVDALSCGMTGVENAALRTACFGALEGTRPVGAPCTDTIQCAVGGWCNRNADAGLPDGGPRPDAGDVDASAVEPGYCYPLRGAGEPCGDVEVSSSIARDSITAEQACSWRGSGNTGLACISYDATNYLGDRSAWKCQPAVAQGEVCNTNVSCNTGLCDPGPTGAKYRCESTLPYFPYQACSLYLK